MWEIHPGSVSVLGLMNDKDHRVTLAIDEDVLKEEMFGCHPCENTSSIRFATKDLVEKILPELGIEPAIVHLVGTEWYGKYPEAKWDSNRKLKAYFEEKTHRGIYELVDKDGFTL